LVANSRAPRRSLLPIASPAEPPLRCGALHLPTSGARFMSRSTRMGQLVLAFSCAVLAASCAVDAPATSSGAPRGAGDAGGIARSGVLIDNLDRSVRPQDDFYRFVNGAWLSTTQIPSDRSNYGAFAVLQEGAESDLRAIVEEAAAANAPPGSDTQKVGDLYASFMDAEGIAAQGLKPLAEELERIDSLASRRDVARRIGWSQRIQAQHPFVYFVGIDEKNSSQYVSIVYQTGLGMPDRDYYLSNEERLKHVRDKYRAFVRDLLAAADTPAPEAAADRILALETELAKAHWTRVENRDAQKTYNRYERSTLRELMPAFDWDAFFEGAQIPADKAEVLIVSQPSYFEALDALIASTPVAVWR